MKKKEETKRFRRPCKKCDEMFLPTSRENRICDSCQEKNRVIWRDKLRGKKK